MKISIKISIARDFVAACIISKSIPFDNNAHALINQRKLMLIKSPCQIIILRCLTLPCRYHLFKSLNKSAITRQSTNTLSKWKLHCIYCFS